MGGHGAFDLACIHRSGPCDGYVLEKVESAREVGFGVQRGLKVLYNKYYVDELYSYTIVKPTLWLANKVVLAITDGKIIEGVVNGVPGSIGWFSEKLRKVQTGLAQR